MFDQRRTVGNLLRSAAALLVGLGLPASPVSALELTVPVPFSTIQGAIDIAAPGDEVIVSPGLYAESISFLGKAITVRSSDGPQVTTIDGSGGGSVVAFTNGEGPASRLVGFTITGGSGNAFSGGVVVGGGVLVVESSPEVEDCTITGNGASDGGGAYVLGGTAGPLFVDCRFLGNAATFTGGGLASEEGSPTLQACLLDGNSAGAVGGGAWFHLGAATIVGSAIVQCDSGLDGGGLAVVSGEAFLQACEIRQNTATNGAGIVVDGATVTMESTLLAANAATNLGGALRLFPVGASVLTATSCTVTDNGALFGGALSVGALGTASATNSIVWQNGDDAVTLAPTATWTVTYSDVEAGGPGLGVIDADPLFTDAAAGIYTLTAGSPCIDAGDPGTFDADGSVADLGAFPYQPGAGQFVRGDCNVDGAFNLGDVVAGLHGLFPSVGGPPSCLDACDGNDDGIYDLGDVVFFINALFLTGAPPPEPPHPGCGPDPTGDSLDCTTSAC